MIQLEFSPETIEQLQYQKRYHPHPRVRQKMEALYLKSLGMPHNQISQLVGIRGRATLVRYLRDYQKHPITHNLSVIEIGSTASLQGNRHYRKHLLII